MIDTDGWNSVIGVADIQRADGPRLEGQGVALHWRAVHEYDFPLSLTGMAPAPREWEVRIECGARMWDWVLGDLTTWTDPIPYVRFDVTTYAGPGQPLRYTFPVFHAVSADRTGRFLFGRDEQCVWRVDRHAAAYGTGEQTQWSK